MTAFMFTMVEVPAPPWIMSTRNSSCQKRATSSSHTTSIMRAFYDRKTRKSAFIRAPAFFTDASARKNSGKCDKGMPRVGKFSIARWVLMPDKQVRGKSIDPRLSRSVRMSYFMWWKPVLGTLANGVRRAGSARRGRKGCNCQFSCPCSGGSKESLANPYSDFSDRLDFRPLATNSLKSRIAWSGDRLQC